MPHTLRAMLIITLLIAPLAGCGNAGEERQSAPGSAQANGILTGQRAPDFTLNDLSGKPFTLSGLRNKKPVLLIFWATWCPACLQAIPYFSELHTRYNPKGLEIIAVNIATKRHKNDLFTIYSKNLRRPAKPTVRYTFPENPSGCAVSPLKGGNQRGVCVILCFLCFFVAINMLFHDLRQ